MKKTVQRIKIFDYLKNNTSHPTAMDIYTAVSEDIATISFTTVYNTLSLLKQQGLIRELVIANQDHKRYDPNILPHAHIICNECSRIVDSHPPLQIEISEEQRQGFDIKTDDIYMYGLCPACKNENKETLTLQEKESSAPYNKGPANIEQNNAEYSFINSYTRRNR